MQQPQFFFPCSSPQVHHIPQRRPRQRRALRQVGQGVVVQRAGVVALAAELHRQVRLHRAHHELHEQRVGGLRWEGRTHGPAHA